jgi:hypothetical protein
MSAPDTHHDLQADDLQTVFEKLFAHSPATASDLTFDGLREWPEGDEAYTIDATVRFDGLPELFVQGWHSKAGVDVGFGSLEVLPETAAADLRLQLSVEASRQTERVGLIPSTLVSLYIHIEADE